MNPSAGKCIPLWFIRYLQITALLPHSINPAPSLKRRIGLIIWGLTMVGVYIYLAYLSLEMYVQINARQLKQFEFFNLLSFIMQIAIYVQAPIHVLIMLWKGHGLSSLIERIEKTLGSELSAGQLMLSKFLLVIFFFYILISIAAVAVSGYIGTLLSHRILYQRRFKIAATERMPDTTAWTIIADITAILTCNADLGVPMLVCFIVACLLLEFKNLQNSLKEVPEKLGQMALVQQTRKVQEKYQRLAVLLTYINQVFSYINLLCCVREMITIISLLASFLKLPFERDLEESQDEADLRLLEENSWLPTLYCYTAVTGLHAVIRYFIFISLDKEHRSFRNLVSKMISESQDEAVMNKYLQLLHVIDNEAFAISAGGFFYFNQEYIIMAFSMILTYFLLIYQTRDNKADMRKLLKANVFQKAYQHLMGNLISFRNVRQNSSLAS